MKKKQSKTQKSVSTQCLNRVKPMNDQRNLQNTKNQSISDQQKQSFHYPSSTEKMKFSSSSQSTTVSWTADKKRRRHHQIQDFIPKKDSNDSERVQHLENWLILIGSFFTILTLTVFLMSIYLYMMINETQITTTTTSPNQIQSNQTNSSVTANQPYYCSGVSPYTLWTLYGSVGIQMTINTRNCSFPSTPLYFTSLGGLSTHAVLGGYTAIYIPTNISFAIYALPLVALTNTVMLNDSQTYQWNLNWFGILD